jgi:Big-like domain-containing protein
MNAGTLPESQKMQFAFAQTLRKPDMHARRYLVLISILPLAACTETTGENLSGLPGYLISSVRISPSVDTISIPDSIRDSDRITFAATAIGKNGSALPAMTFAWSTSNPLIATVDSSGVVTPRSLGEVEISAAADKVGRARLVILPATMVVSISPAADTIQVSLPIVSARDTVRLQASARDLSGGLLGGVAFSWGSSSPSIATVDATGLVHAMAVGSTTISASANGHFASAIVHVIATGSGFH